MARPVKIPRLPEHIESLQLSKQQKEICTMILEHHLDSVEMARRLAVTPKTIRNQIGRIWEKAANKAHKKVNTTPQGVNHAQNTPGNAPEPETLRNLFSTQTQRISYLRQRFNLGNREIAEILRIKESNVKQVLSRCKTQKVSRTFYEPVAINPVSRSRSPIEEAVLQDGARMFYNKFVAGTNTAPAREVLRGLHLTGQGGREARKIVLGDRARIMRLLSELSHCQDARSQIIRVDEDDRLTRRACEAVLKEHFRQILPGHYKPKDGAAIALLQSTLQSVLSEAADASN